MFTKLASGALAYSSPESVISYSARHGRWQTKLASGDILTPTAGALLDFACVLTSTREDRDGDILESSGAAVDGNMPLLFQHDARQPVGKFCELVSRTKSAVVGHFAVADTMLGRDCATLIELGALRMSIGFRVISSEPRKDKARGWRITKFEIVETSLVSVPSNEDCVISAFQRGKLVSESAKRIAVGAIMTKACDGLSHSFSQKMNPDPVDQFCRELLGM